MEDLKKKNKDNYFKYRNVSEVTYKKYKLPRYLLKELDYNHGLKILDIGCGFGQMLLALRENNFTNVRGVDISKDAVDTCRKNKLDVELIDNIQNYCEDYKGEKFQVILMSHVLEHLPKDEVIEVLSLIRKYLLSDNGRLIAMVPNAQSNTHAYWAYEDFTHNTLFTSGSIYYVLKAAGFESIVFLDPKGISGFNLILQAGFNFFLTLYKLNRMFWNIVTLSFYHKASPQIFTYELKVRAMNKIKN